jgi:serine/threonine protein kinase
MVDRNRKNNETLPLTRHTQQQKITADTTRKTKKQKTELSIEQFSLDRVLGQGAFGMVYLAKHIESGKYCAIKQVDKKFTTKLGKEEHAKIEKRILTCNTSPHLLKAICTWQDSQLAWLALEYCPGGDLKEFLEVVNRFEEKEVILYFAEMIMGVHDLHSMGYIHRDIKPPNFLIDRCGHIKLADFGLARSIHTIGKMNAIQPREDNVSKPPVTITPEEIEHRKLHYWKRPTNSERNTLSAANFSSLFKSNNPTSMNLKHSRLSEKISPKTNTITVIPNKKELRKEYGYSIVGSPEYMSPEVTEGRNQGGSYYGQEVDWWSLGCVFYEMIFGDPPFTGDTVEELFSQIDLWSNKLPIIFEENREHLSPACYSLLTGFLCDPKERLGRDIEKIKTHEFFEGLNWSNLHAMTPAFVPQPQQEISYMIKQ